MEDLLNLGVAEGGEGEGEGEGEKGETMDQLLLICYHQDHKTTDYVQQVKSPDLGEGSLGELQAYFLRHPWYNLGHFNFPNRIPEQQRL